MVRVFHALVIGIVFALTGWALQTAFGGTDLSHHRLTSYLECIGVVYAVGWYFGGRWGSD